MAKMTKIRRLIISVVTLIMAINFAVETSAYSISRSIADSLTALTPKIAAAKDAVSLPKGYHECRSVDDAAAYMRKKLTEHDKKIKFSLKLDDQPDFDELTEKLRQKACEHTGNPTEGDYILYQTGFEYAAEVYLLDNDYLYYFTVDPIYFTTKEQEVKLDARVEEVIKNLDLDELSDYEKVKRIYNYLVKNVSYDQEIEKRDGYIAYSAYAALIDGRAVCQGYANLLYRLCLEVGVDCRIVSGTCSNEGHAWNIIKIGSYYYHADATWDAVRKDDQYFLKCPDNISDHILYDQYKQDDFVKAYLFNDIDCTADSDTVTVTFNAGGGICTVDVRQLKCGERLKSLPLAAKENAVFTGWYTADGEMFAVGQNVRSSVELIAGWKQSLDNSGLHKTLKDKSGVSLSTDSSKMTTVLVFGDTESSYKTRKMLDDLAQSDYAGKKNVRIIYIDILDNGSKKGYSIPNDIIVCPYSEDNAAVCWSYRKELVPGISNITLPYIIVIDGSDKIVYSAAGQAGYSSLKSITFNSIKKAIS